jgi:hypothetical protein
MKIESGRGVTPSGGGRKAGGTAGASGFSPAIDGPQRTAAASASAAVTSLDAILALQAEDGPPQRRARQARRGRAALDALEQLEQGLLLGRAPASVATELQRLHAGAEITGDEGLDSVLREIDTRVAVELAKLERLRARA